MIAILKNLILSIILLSLLVAVGCNGEEVTEPDNPIARVKFIGMASDSDSTFSQLETEFGEAVFYSENDHLRLEIKLQNLTPNTTHAIHIHEGTCSQPGAHWNQNQPVTTKFCSEVSLGNAWAKPFAGDVGNLSVGYDGTGTLNIRTDFWTIGSENDTDLIDQAMIIHLWESDFNDECDPFHDHTHPHFNPKIACGIITAI